MSKGFSVKPLLTGDWGAAINSMAWLEKRLPKALAKAVKDESKDLAKKMKKDLRKGGNPPFAAISPFTRAIRRAAGTRSRRPGIATGTVLKSIKAHKVGALAYFAGVKKGTSHPGSGRGTVVDAADAASMLEFGRDKFFLQLDRPSPQTGKTPRQWLWWLYFSGAIKNPPGFTATHIEIGESPARPFVAPLLKREEKRIPKRLMQRLITSLSGVRMPPALTGAEPKRSFFRPSL